MQKNTRIPFIAQAAVIAALYVAISLPIAMSGPIAYLNYGPIQFRIAEALAMLAALTPAAIPGLAIGCLLTNILGPYGVPDMVFGTLASLLAALCTYWLRKITFSLSVSMELPSRSFQLSAEKLPLFSALPPVLFNAVIIGTMIAYFFMDSFEWSNILLFGAQVGFGQAVVVFLLGLPLAALLKKTKIFSRNEV